MSKTLKRDTYSSNLEKKIPSRNRMNWHIFLLPAYFAFFHWFISLCQRYAIKSLILLNQRRIITHLIRYHHNHCYNPTHCHVLVYSLCLFSNHNLHEIEAESNNYKTRNIRIRTGTLIGRPAERDETSRYPFISSP